MRSASISDLTAAIADYQYDAQYEADEIRRRTSCAEAEYRASLLGCLLLDDDDPLDDDDT